MMTKKQQYQQLISSKDPDAPFCACGCGRKTKWSIRTKSYGRYLFNHHLQDLSDNWTDRIEQIVRGTVLGDGHIAPIKSRSGGETGKARLAIRHSTKRQAQYTEWLHRELQPITTSRIRTRPTPAAYGKEISEFSTTSTKRLYEIRNELYVNGVKTVTRAYLDGLTDLSFAVWWMDDGSTATLSTHSFTEYEQQVIIKWAKERYGMDMFVDMDRRVNLPYLRYHINTIKIVHDIVFPHTERSLWYKFGRHLPRLLEKFSASAN